MKKLLFRLFAIIFFCLASFAIKSETSVSKRICPLASATAVPAVLKIIVNDIEDEYYKFDAFFIKI